MEVSLLKVKKFSDYKTSININDDVDEKWALNVTVLLEIYFLQISWNKIYWILSVWMFLEYFHSDFFLYVYLHVFIYLSKTIEIFLLSPQKHKKYMLWERIRCATQRCF